MKVFYFLLNAGKISAPHFKTEKPDVKRKGKGGYQRHRNMN